VLEVIEKNGLEDVVIVVVRYFGGTLLGAAGLVRAYGKAAAMAVEAAGIAGAAPAEELLILAGYPFLGAIRNEIEKSGFVIRGVQYGMDAEIAVQAPKARIGAFLARVADLTGGTAVVETIGISQFFFI
jgi:putative IMPACT (imprinted ancient) family translation regulator